MAVPEPQIGGAIAEAVLKRFKPKADVRRYYYTLPESEDFAEDHDGW